MFSDRMDSMNIGSIEDMRKFAKDVVGDIHPQNGAVVIGLKGDLGTGKTLFVQCVARILGVLDTVTSPTFVIQKTYQLKGSMFDNLVHIDAYRIEDPHELEVLHFEHTLQNAKNLILIEWPEKIESILPKSMKVICFKYIDETNREVAFQG